MASFEMKRTDDPRPWRGQILRLWGENLPGTPVERFEWMQEGNPAGPATWFLALEKGADKVAGTMSIMPKRVYLGGREHKAGILGDFMVDASHRVFGPNRMLMKAPLNALDEMGISFICTVPNESSRKVAEHAGIRYATRLDCFAKPLDYRFYLEKRLPTPLAALTSPLVGAAFRLSSRETWLRPSCPVEETSQIGAQFDSFWERLRSGASGMISDRSSEYLRWRYQANPLYRFRFLTCLRDGGGISGYAVFCTREGNKIDIYDIQAEDGASFDALTARLTGTGRAEGSQAIYMIAPDWSPYFGRLGRFRFIDAKDRLQLGFFGGADLPLDEWHFLSGDRNI